MSDPAEEGVIHRKRFLIVDGDREVLDSLERYLLMEAAPKVYKAKAPLAALRILQDDNTAVDCVICANKHGKISGMEFLQNLRTGRWGGPSVRDVNFFLMMEKEDEAIIRTADSLNVTGYIFGELDRISAIETINQVLELGESQSPLMKCPIAHVRLGGADVIAVAFDKSFGQAPQDEQQLMMEKEDEAIIRTADSLNVTGYIFGELDRISAIETINQVLEVTKPVDEMSNRSCSPGWG